MFAARTLAARTATAARRAVPQAARRNMSGSDVYVIGGKEFSTEAVVGGVFSFYCILAFVGTRGGKKKEAAAPAAAAPGGAVMSMMDDGFDAWASVPANMKLWEESVAKME
mmetsp:Transcript_18149/g.53954  ORF Transcript_18149/g.53954 Transcript_18149/m.53954 type:complete len:111 (+) Transcript_18149:72-404(+)|eukprot:CAMPEP_0119259208 /NCGR_PEP_ID=MMETSP1329-20130426/116_1 /TAXON_ID=114041 /ORGANISM="Genus nov. species nov., Strain RCC1024" /LENGTH=110 /DNA_ID=CAMNT_0007258573 /DNA_START=70 /DNA_END=402 /DNA_ORIENTATION=-